jgi:hypothetical protein
MRITDDDKTFLEWKTSFSSDVTANLITDNRYKKLEMFKDIKKTINLSV